MQEICYTQETRESFARWVENEVGEDPGYLYLTWIKDWQQAKLGEEDRAGVMYIRPWHFAYQRGCSKTGPVMLHKAKIMAEHVLADGLVTHSEPLFVQKPVVVP